jgi:hypothetical protein
MMSRMTMCIDVSKTLFRTLAMALAEREGKRLLCFPSRLPLFVFVVYLKQP